MTGLNILSTLSARQSLSEILPLFERLSGSRIHAEFVGASALKSRTVSAHEADVFIGPDDICAAYLASNTLAPEGRCEIGVSRSAAAIPAGAPRPTLGSSEQLVTYLLGLPSICWGAGSSAVHFVNVLRKYGADDAVLARRVVPRPGEPVGEVVARGDAAFGVQQLSELMPVAGLQLLTLPAEFEVQQTYSANRFSQTAKTREIDAFIDFLGTDVAVSIFQRNGLQAA